MGVRVATCSLLLLLCAPGRDVLAQRTVRFPTPQRPAAEQAAHERLLAELGRLREAADLEMSGRPAQAEKIVREVLAVNPASLTALLALERVLQAQGRLSEVVPVVDSLLALDPGSVVGHQTRLRVLNGLDDPAGIQRAADQWVRVSPDIETPYREVAAVWRRRGQAERAIRLLEEGRRRVDMPDALALELGDAWADAGEPGKAAAEWARAIGAEGRGFLLVQRRLQELADGGASIIPSLVGALTREEPTAARQRAATLFATDAGLEDQARELATALVAATPAGERQGVLVELARRADNAHAWHVGRWAWGELLQRASDPGSALAIRSRVAALALLTGDTVTAAAEYRVLEEAAAAGSPQRRQAIALRIQLAAREGLDAARGARAELDAFHREYPQAPEHDATAAAVAGALLEGGDLDGAETVLRAVRGPSSAQLGARLALHRGDVAAARSALVTAAPQLSGREATETIALAGLLGRVSPEAGVLVSRVVVAPDESRPAAILEAAAESGALPESERAALLDFLAASAERSGLTADAASLRRVLVEQLPRAAEVPAALLALARGSADREEARMLLERLIVEHPASPLAPRARTELQRLGDAEDR